MLLMYVVNMDSEIWKVYVVFICKTSYCQWFFVAQHPEHIVTKQKQLHFCRTVASPFWHSSVGCRLMTDKPYNRKITLMAVIIKDLSTSSQKSQTKLLINSTTKLPIAQPTIVKKIQKHKWVCSMHKKNYLEHNAQRMARFLVVLN